MKANELRIGNLVLGVDNKEYHVIGIFGSEDSGVSLSPVRESNTSLYRDTEFKNLNGIPLTEEWLKKFGTKEEATQDSLFQTPYLLLREDGYMWIEFQADGHYDLFLKQKNTDGTCDSILLDVELKFVHQLQNLYFALTGEELTIK